jgi:maltose/maltodextrin transport system substrate-binding protein
MSSTKNRLSGRRDFFKNFALIFITTLLTSLVLKSYVSAQNWGPSDWIQFHNQALEESLIPIRQGEPEVSPFWNVYSRSFTHVPSFDFKRVDHAVKYLFTVISDKNNKLYSFEADLPWATLTPVWKDLPVGIVYLKVEGLDANGTKVGIAGERLFYRAAPFNGPYKSRVMDYTSSAKLNMKSLFNQDHYQRWLTEPTPGPEYSLYCYPSKIIGSIVDGMALYSKLSPEDKERALTIARNAADYLISISQPEGAVLEYFPPTYAIQDNSTQVAKDRIGQIMMFYPAIVGNAFLELYELVQEKKFLNAAIKIAQTYQKQQLQSGTWPLMADIKTGEAISKNYCVPTDIISFLDRLINSHGIVKLSDTRARAFNWILSNPMKTFHWEGQFEDMGFSKNYSNMERGKPLAFALLLFKQAEVKPEYIKMAEELIRFSEDQFVVWERPLPRELFRTAERPIPKPAHRPEEWMTPCALEQYDYYTPIDASAASAILAFRKAYEVTGKELYLAKAISLADAQTYAQNLGGGIYPTNQMGLKEGAVQPKVWDGWINCATVTASALLELDKTLKARTKD